MNAPIKAIVYTSNAGHTKEYAELLSKEIKLPAYALEQSDSLENGTAVIYMGWLMAGKIAGYKKAAKRFAPKLVCCVGMGAGDDQLKDIRKSNPIADNVPVAYLQGGFDISKLHGLYRFMMSAMRKTVGKKLQAKENRTPDENDMLEMMINGSNKVDAGNLTKVIEIYHAL